MARDTMARERIVKRGASGGASAAALLVLGCSGATGPGDAPPGSDPPPPGSEAPPPDGVVAFPGAEGFGAFALGGRGGRVLYVTSLEDDGPGSLREAVETPAARLVLFALGGTIDLRSPLTVTEPFLTIAGQTAPGGGITLRNAGTVQAPMLDIRTHDVIVRHLRVRPGPDVSAEGSGNLDALSIAGGADVHDVIVDHVSLAWAVDEVAQIFQGAHYVTIQWSVLAEGLYCSNHQKTVSSRGSDGPCPDGANPHSRGMTISTFPGDPLAPDRISLHHNVWASTNKRFPNINSETSVDFVENVVYHFGDFGAKLISGKNPDDRARLNYVGNVVIPGPSTGAPPRYAIISDAFSATRPHEVYVADNVVFPPLELLGPEIEANGMLVASPFPAPPVTRLPPGQVFESVLAGAGATRPLRDEVDERIVREVTLREGRFVDHPDQVGGWPVLSAGEAPVDGDGDGMPDAWETAQGFDPSDPSDGNRDRDGDGWTNIEEYLNESDPGRAGS